MLDLAGLLKVEDRLGTYDPWYRSDMMVDWAQPSAYVCASAVVNDAMSPKLQRALEMLTEDRLFRREEGWRGRLSPRGRSGTRSGLLVVSYARDLELGTQRWGLQADSLQLQQSVSPRSPWRD